MIFDPFGFINELDSRYYCCITGKNRSGKDLAAIAISEHYLSRKDEKYRLLYNKPCVWNDDYLLNMSYSEICDKDGKTNVIIPFSEGGWYFRTMDTYKEFLVTIGMLNNRLLIPSRQLPHEEMQQFILYPRGFYNGYINIFIFEVFDFGNDKPKRRPVIFLFPKRYYYIYQTGGYPAYSKKIFSWIMRINAEYALASGIDDPRNYISDLAKPGQGMASDVSYHRQRLSTISTNNKASPTKAKK